MTVDPPLEFAAVLDAPHAQRLLLDETGTAPLLTILRSTPGENRLVDRTGRRLDPARTRRRSHRRMVCPLLSASPCCAPETAALAALSLVQGWFWAQAAPDQIPA